MKKIYFFTFIFLAIFLNTWFFSYAYECPSNCKIEHSASPGLEQYFRDLDIILRNIQSQSSGVPVSWWQAAETARKIRLESQKVVSQLTRTLNFWEYYCSFDYYLTLNITNETPSQILRDTNRIQQAGDRIMRILESTARRGVWWITWWEDICNWVNNCPFWWEKLHDIITVLLQNNNLILQNLQASILEKPCAPNIEMILVSSSFLRELKEYYNKDTLAYCSSCKDEFIWRTMRWIQNISIINSDYRAGIQAWREAWAMLKWSFVPSWHPEERERDDALESDWWNSNPVSIIHRNRQRYDVWWLSTSSVEDNHMHNSMTQIHPRVPDFSESIRQEMESRQSRISIIQIPTTESGVGRTQTISQTIEELYNSQIPYSLIQDTQSEEILLRMLRMHVRLSESINLLESFRKRSERICDKQGVGMWQCVYK